MLVSQRTLSNSEMLINDGAVADWKRGWMLTLILYGWHGTLRCGCCGMVPYNGVGG